MNEQERQMIDDARRLEMLAASISSDTPKPRRARRGALQGGQPPNVLVGDNGGLTVQRRGKKPVWK